MEEALAQLEQLCRLMADLGLAENLRLDFSIVNDMNYYNGVISVSYTHLQFVLAFPVKLCYYISRCFWHMFYLEQQGGATDG